MLPQIIYYAKMVLCNYSLSQFFYLTFALSPGIIPIFAVLPTAVSNTAKLGIGPSRGQDCECMAVLYDDFRAIFFVFLLRVSVP